MTHSIVLVFALLIGAVAGMRAVTAPAVVAWAALLRWINMDGTWASWVGHPVTVAVVTVAAVIELIADVLPTMPSRTTAPQFAARIVLGAASGAVIGAAWGYTVSGLGAGITGAALGTLGGYEVRKRLVAVSGGRDLPVAVAEDVVAVAAGVGIAALTAAL